MPTALQTVLSLSLWLTNESGLKRKVRSSSSMQQLQQHHHRPSNLSAAVTVFGRNSR